MERGVIQRIRERIRERELELERERERERKRERERERKKERLRERERKHLANMIDDLFTPFVHEISDEIHVCVFLILFHSVSFLIMGSILIASFFP